MAVMARLSSVLLLSLVVLAGVAFATEEGVHIDVQHLPEICEAKAQQGDYVSVHYVGKLTDGYEFDNSYNNGNPIEFQLGAQQVIVGWEQGILGMCVGEKRRLQIPPHLAYGEEGIGPIPGDATLVFDVELVRLSAEPQASTDDGYAGYDVYNGFGGESYPEGQVIGEGAGFDEEGQVAWEE